MQIDGVLVPYENAAPAPRVHIHGDGMFHGLQHSDGSDISTRTKHREFMKERGLALHADFKDTWAKAAEQRADHYTTGGDHKDRREAVERAIHTLEGPT